MRTIELGYNNDFTGRARDFETADFTNANIKDHYVLGSGINLFVRNDGALLFTSVNNGRCYISSNRQYSYSLSEKPNTVTLKF